MKPVAFLPRPAAVALAAVAVSLAGCSTLENWLGGEKVDYRNTAKSRPLEVPPDLTQLARDTRYQTAGGVVSAAAGASAPAGGGFATAAAGASVALNAEGGMRIARDGQQRWLVVPLSPEQLWPQLRPFWEERGFTLAREDAKTGIMETNWLENRAKLPNDFIRSSIGRVFGGLFDTGERDAFRTRVERTATGSEVYITHRGAQEVYVNSSRTDEGTTWRGRPNDPQLEAEYLSRLMVQLGGGSGSGKDDASRTAAAAAGAASAATVAAAPRQPLLTGTGTGATSLVVEEGFDRAWRRVGLALDRGGFTVEDRDRAAGLYYVRYVDPRNAGKEEPNWFMKWFSSDPNPQAALRYRIALKTADNKTTVTVLNNTGALETGDNAKRIVALLTNELR